jgi:hypothetical protein
MGNLNSLESYTAVVKLNIGNSAMRHPYSYQVVQVDGFITVCLNLQMVSNSIHDALVQQARKTPYSDSST